MNACNNWKKELAQKMKEKNIVPKKKTSGHENNFSLVTRGTSYFDL